MTKKERNYVLGGKIKLKEIQDRINDDYPKLRKIIENSSEMLIVLHNNPDPDALASGFALAHLARFMGPVSTSLAYGGNIGRRENQTMVSLLNIGLKQINRVKYSKYDCIAVIDTQPGAGNNFLPQSVEPQIIIDHHPKRKNSKAELTVVEQEVGATASILTHWLRHSGCQIPADLATALSYAIITETQNMFRETSQFDLESYLFIYPMSSLRKLAKIINPPLPHEYYLYFVSALENAVMYKNLLVSHMGEVSSPEFVAEMADFLIRHRYISWSLCTGICDDKLFLSIRSTKADADANRIIKSIVEDADNVGGHSQLAGGFLELDTEKKSNLSNLYREITQNIARETGNSNEAAEYKPLLDRKRL